MNLNLFPPEEMSIFPDGKDRLVDVLLEQAEKTGLVLLNPVELLLLQEIKELREKITDLEKQMKAPT